MRTASFLTAALLACVAASAPGTPSVKNSSSTKICGDYVEARDASVFAGACHYNGELVTIGHDAVMAWKFTSGSYDGVDLTNVRAMAAIASEANLGDEHAARKSELVIDSSATSEQAAAVAKLLESRCGTQLGQVAVIRRAPITFSHSEDGYSVSARGFASLDVQNLPDDSCCKQPNLVWYSPLSPTDHRKVGYTESASYSGSIGDPWQRSGENSAFYGQIAF